jgi:glycosyltransferase involved in cell wall biosynthesis
VAAVGAVAGLGVLGLVSMRELLIPIAYGAAYAPASGLVPVLALAFALLAIVNVLVFFHIAAGTRAYVFLLGAAAVEAPLAGLFHDDGRQLALVTLAVAAGAAMIMLHAAVAVTRWAPHHPAGSTSVLASPPECDLSVVLPCHNAAENLQRVLSETASALADVGTWELIVVSDGSTDETVAVAEASGVRVRVIQYLDRIGKGHALRVGLAEARGKYVAFIDGDGDLPPSALRPFIALMHLYSPDIILGSKRHPLSDVDYPALRRVLSWGYHKFARVLFRIGVSDTQTGLKLLRRDVLVDVLPRMLEKRYAFDLELLVVARVCGYTRLLEAPIQLEYQFSSRIDVRATFGIFVDTMAIFYRRYVLRTYTDVDAGSRSSRKSTTRRRDRRRIVMVNWKDIHHPASGGAEVYVHEIARRWVDRGYVVELVSAGFPGAAARETIDGVRVRRLGRLHNGTFHLLVQRELCRARSADVVVESINTLPFLALLHRRAVPVVALVYQLAAEVWDAELPRPFGAIGRHAEPKVLSLYRHVPTVTISPSTEQDLSRLGFRDLSVVRPGRDEPPTTAVLEKEPTPTFAFVGRLEANKRPDHALAAFSLIGERLPNARLWVIGRGSFDERLRADAPPGAEILGRLTREELYDRLGRAHCLLVPSVREGWGLVVVEANAVGTPAVGYDVPGLRDSIVHERTGVLVPAGDPHALAAAAVNLVRDGRYSSIEKAARQWAAAFSWDRAADSLLEVVERSMRTGTATVDAVEDGLAFSYGAATGA